MIRSFIFLLLISTLFSCSPVSQKALNKNFKSLEAKLHDHTGFMLYDPVEKKELYSYQGGQYFTPASNTKIFTLYTGLLLLGDSVPALQYLEKGDSLIFRGTGDPSFLYPLAFDSRNAFDFLKTSNKQLFIVEDNFYATPLGPGWAWSDYYYTYSAERSAFPLYGNYFTAEYNGSKLNVAPRLFAYDISVGDSTEEAELVRDLGSNKISFLPGRNQTKPETWEVPFKTGVALTTSLLSDTLGKKVTVLKNSRWDSKRTLYSVPADSLYKVMMQESDNFIAEQILLMCAGILSDSLDPEIAIVHMKENFLKDLPDQPVWVDGSGLSRFNLFTPRSIVKLWEKIYERVPRERLFQLLAIGGKTGTIRNWYKNDPPYIYGKTGTLSNNHTLSGYLVARSGKTLIFSFMSNNFPASSIAVRNEMSTILKSLYEHY
jgi:D-alanyl-D-alanine carboxypeptidase/D-alanyl-D-alanine-endopeptidase (penicillin-binding protein 4)